MAANVTGVEVVGGINASADTFYGSQGAPRAQHTHASAHTNMSATHQHVGHAPALITRVLSHVALGGGGTCFICGAGRAPKYFDDRNEHLLEQIEAKHPDLAVCEMETNHLCVRVSVALPHAGA